MRRNNKIGGGGESVPSKNYFSIMSVERIGVLTSKFGVSSSPNLR